MFRRQRAEMSRRRPLTIDAISSSKIRVSRLARTRAPVKYVSSDATAESPVLVEVSTLTEDGVRKDSVELSMEEKRTVGGQEAAAEKLKSRLLQLQKSKEEEKFTSIKPKLPGSAKMTEVDNFMSRFPYKSCQRSVIGELRIKRSLSQPCFGRYGNKK